MSGTARVGGLREAKVVGIRLSTRRSKMNATAYNPKMLPPCHIPIRGRAFRFVVYPLGWPDGGRG